VQNIFIHTPRENAIGANQMNPLEIEVKFHISNPSGLKHHILELGAESQGRFFETNIRFEDSQNSFLQRESILRLRKDRKTTLTFKSKAPDQNHEFKILRELEVEVSNFHVMQNILEALGFHEEQIYEKWRETLTLNNLIFCIDTMPYGIFLEIEGKGNEIIESAHWLNLCWEHRILANYLSIFERIKTKLNLSFSDVTFENFKPVGASFDHIIQSFQEGKKD
jgi:adenylate cyclase, class 2